MNRWASITRVGLIFTCVSWGLALGGCQSHPLALRSSLDWSAVRVLPGEDTSDPAAIPVRIKHGDDMYFLVREWLPSSVPSGGGSPSQTLTQAYPDRGDRVGFVRRDDGAILAIAGLTEFEVEAQPGTQLVWYVPQPTAAETVGDTLAFVGAAVLVAGFLVLVWSLDSDRDDDCDCRARGWRCWHD